jgi:hypothetical protein
VGTPCRNPGVQIIRAATFHDPMNTLRRFVHRIFPQDFGESLLSGISILTSRPTESVHPPPIMHCTRQVFECRAFSAAAGKYQSPKFGFSNPFLRHFSFSNPARHCTGQNGPIITSMKRSNITVGTAAKPSMRVTNCTKRGNIVGITATDGNFLAPDEVLINGMACRPVKPRWPGNF